MSYKTLGTLEIVHTTNSYSPGGTKMRQVLALLLVNANTVVGTDAIIDELWRDSPPRSVATTLQTYVYQLRKAFRAEFPGHPIGGALRTRSPGYTITVPHDQVDANAFERLAREGRALFDRGRPADAHARLCAALDLWRGEFLENVPHGRRLHSHAVLLDELRVETLQLKIAAEMRLGRNREAISQLRTLTERHPLNEWFYGQLMCALSRAGRRGEALQVYQRLRTTLDRELGLEPSAEIKRFHVGILRDDERLRDPGPTVSALDIAAIGRF
ncbi:AfsR/SARP family transcriptional regulator [Nocardiopsis trehalosi]|jgi:pentatricopeptide repeat protein|uniref:AfsR/SARP family transcriptional regulator n=1 Tax=Nocardiopsis trehalosi TaxID=109329 RepID=UPI000A0368D9|nr:AfsR/SARP family transcriptional regulator [Nocardiopsis trehalosi]